MENFTENDYAFASRFKSARRKKKLVKKDFEKQLHFMHTEELRLFKAKSDLPIIMLQTPYQKGWIRYFVLRNDVLRLSNAPFFEQLLTKINTYHYSYKKTFSKKIRKNGKKIEIVESQHLYQIPVYQWNCEKFGLTDLEKTYFSLVEEWSVNLGRMIQFYQFNESWRFVLQTRPNIITHKKAINEVLERELRWIENQITNKHLRCKIEKLKTGRGKYKWFYQNEIKPKYSDPNKNKSLQEYYQDYVNENIK